MSLFQLLLYDYIIRSFNPFFYVTLTETCQFSPHREGVAKALWGLQKRGLLEYSLSLPAVYVTVNVLACYDSILDMTRSGERGGERGEGQGEGNRVGSALVYSNDYTTTSIRTSITATTASNSTRESSSKSDGDSSTILNDWVWHLSVRVCEVLTRIESGVSRRSGDMWRVGNVIASACVPEKNLGSDSRSKSREGELCMEVKNSAESSLESDAQEGASSFLCRYLEMLSGRDATYGVKMGRKVGQKALKHSLSESATVGEDKGVVEDGSVTLDLKSPVVWEEKFFAVPLPVTTFPALSSPNAAAGGRCPGVFEEVGGQDGDENNNSGDSGKDGETVEGEEEGDGEGRDGQGQLVEMNICEFQGSATVAECGSFQPLEEETSSEIRALKRDVLSLSRDPRLLHVRDRIANPVLRAFASHGQHGHGQGGRQAGPSWAPKLIKGPQTKASSMNGKITWKNRPVSGGDKNSDCVMGLGPVIPEILWNGKAAVCTTQTENTENIGSAELLAVLIARILHGLPSKLLTTAAWKDQTVCWGQYRNYSFESLLKACRRIIFRVKLSISTDF
jgi:hypothetical protein